MQRHGQFPLQTLSGHFQNVVDACITRSRFEVEARAAMQVKNVAMAIDQRTHGCHLLQQGALGQFAHRQFLRARYFVPNGARCRISGQGVERLRQKAIQGSAPDSQKVVFSLVKLGFSVQYRKQVRKLTHCLGSAQKQNATRQQCVVKHRDQLLLQLGAQVDHQIAAADEVKLGEWRVFDDVLF